jgi:hypothetical protein
MPFADVYRRQVVLLIHTLPVIAEEKGLALKGGTAINLFMRNMPRLPVDVDLTYVPVQPRPESRRRPWVASMLASLIWRLLSRPLHLRCFHPPGQIVSKTRKRALQCVATVADRLALG